LYRLVVHELTHQFEFDIIPTSLVRRSVPLWVNEGLSDYMTGIWRPIDLMTVRDAAVADIVPKMTELESYTTTGSVRMVYNLGHAVFEFIESRWGKEGIRQYLFSLRKSVIGGGEDAYMEAFKLTPEEFVTAATWRPTRSGPSSSARRPSSPPRPAI
ncbi:MAG: translocation protein TolB, partial [Acidobacteria bacterium]|nr:translocation protein TolB [Acidobacteriota bacterium]